MSETLTTTVDPIPTEYPRVTPYVITRNAAGFRDFVVEVFGATDRGRFVNEDGTIGHGELQLGEAVILTFDRSDSWPETPAFLSVYVEDCDAVHRKALDAGATEITSQATTFYGDRGGRVRDPYGNIWWIQSRVEVVDDAAAERRLEEGGEYLDALIRAQQTLDEALQGA
jgi:PhnB protein